MKTSTPARWTFVPLWLGLFIPHCLSADNPQQQELIRGIDRAQSSRETNLAGYVVTECYTISNSHFDAPAKAIIETTYRRGEGKTYRVLSRSGPTFLQERVIDRVLQQEKDMSKGKQREEAVLTSRNYEMKLTGSERVGGIQCDVLEVIPKRKSPYLLKGHIWVSSANKSLVKIEGKPPTSAALFAGRPEIVRQYKEIDGFAFAYRSHAVTSNFFLGQSVVDIEYRDYRLLNTPN